MLEKEIYQEAILKLKENKVTDAQLLLKNMKSFQNQKLLGLIYCILGNFNIANSIFIKLSKIKKNDNITKYLEFLEKSIKSEYFPLFNKLISEIKSESCSNIEEIIIKLENISPNTELYSIATLYFLKEKNIKKAKIYYKKLKQLDESNVLLNKIDFYLNKNIFKRKMGFIYLVLMLSFIGLGKISYKNNSLKKTINKTNLEILSLKTKLLEKESEFSKVLSLQNKNTSNNYNIPLANDNSSKMINTQEKLIFDSSNVPLTANEWYNLALKRISSDKFEEAITIFKLVNPKKLPEYKKRELTFQKARAYEKLNNKEKALETYKEYLKNSDKKDYELYLNIVRKRIRKLSKEI